MIELRTFGGVDLRGVDSSAASELLAQPRPTALLSYLAIARPGDFLRRDLLVSLFWAESDQSHARANLRKLIHVLRRLLTDELIETRGDEEIRLTPTAFWCDAAEYEVCIARGDHGRAIELYRGPLLPGFIVAGAPGFQSWLDATRRRLSRQSIKSALSLAEDHARHQERTKASDLAQFIGDREPELEDEHQLRKLLQVLVNIGDRAGALRMFDDFRQRLWRDYHALPAPETRAIAEQIRGD
jgi:DNA-binding SARP family transcriptional activator